MNFETPNGSMKLYKFFYITESGTFENHPCYRIFNNKDQGQIGIISWYKPWKKYVFSSKEGIVFDKNCLKDILDFISNLK